MTKYVCTICGYVYDEAAGIPADGIAPGTRWEDLPPNWQCPICGALKADFREQAPAPGAKPVPKAAPAPVHPAGDGGELRELTPGQLSALCSSLARGCEKQYLPEESALFTKLADFFRGSVPEERDPGAEKLLELVGEDLETGFPEADAAARSQGDRGALRALVWSEKVSRMLSSLLSRYQREGSAFLANTGVYVCTVCGFVYVGETPPELCPVCKVPGWKFAEMEGR